MTAQSTLATSKKLTDQEAYELGLETYSYFYPLLTMDLTRRQMTNSRAAGKPGHGPANTFSHMRAYPEADFKGVVRPNFDTLYSSAWLDLREEPLVVSLPDTNGRYYLLPILDMWTDVFAVPGWRTSGTGAQSFALVPQGWSGELPQGVQRIDVPTPYAWIIGRIKTDGPQDYEAVHRIQDEISLVPLSMLGKSGFEPPVENDASVDLVTPPLEQINSMSASAFFSRAAELMKEIPPHVSDWSMIEKLKKIGFVAGNSFDFESLDKETRDNVERGTKDALANLKKRIASIGRFENGWVITTDVIGVYGNCYINRAVISMAGLGANPPEDAVYPLNISDEDGDKLSGDKKYVLHFDSDKLPPVSAFWSLTMYDEDGFQCANSLNRFAISSWMPLKKNSDGSLDLYIQHENPGKDKEANWLPAPAKGNLGLTMRLYAPHLSVLNREWAPPAIKKA